MFKFRFFSLVVVLVMLVLGLSAVPVFADSGGIKVDDDRLCADDPTEKASDRETNLLGNGVGAFVWLNAPAGADTTLYCEITGQGDSKDAIVSSFSPTFTQCDVPDDNFYWAPFTTPGVAGVYTMTCYSDEGDVISKDTWRQV